MTSQTLLLSRRIPELSSAEYRDKAIELKFDKDWHYGYLSTIHGNVLARTRHTGDHAVPEVPADAEVTSVMRNELQELPQRALLEGAFYVFIAAFLLFPVPWLWGRPRLLRASRLIRASAAGVIATMTGAIILMPQIVRGYGWSAFTTWAGPYAMSFSGLYARVT